MKRITLLFLQAVTAFIGLVALALLIRFPLTEGRAANLDWVSIYADPFILYGYAASSAFFVALYQIFQSLDASRRNKLFSSASVRKLTRIKYCAFLLSGLLMTAGLYSKLLHHKDDDPAGFLALYSVATFLALVLATTAALGEKIGQKAIARKSGNSLSI